MVRVEGFDQREDVLRGGRRADLDGHRIADLTRELDVGAAGSTGTLPDPQQVIRQPVGAPAPHVGSGQRPLIVQKQGLVAGVEFHRTGLLRIQQPAQLPGLYLGGGEPGPQGLLFQDDNKPLAGLIDDSLSFHAGGDGGVKIVRGFQEIDPE